MKKTGTLFTLLLVVNFLHAQLIFQPTYDWDANYVKPVLSDHEKSLDQVMLSEKIGTHFTVNAKNEVEEYNYTHRIYYVNTDKGIERLNKFYIYNQNALRVEKLKARVINPDGKIFLISEKDIKEFKNEYDQVEYKYFAFEGIQKGCVIEYLEINVYKPRFTGNSITIQNDLYKKAVEVEIVSENYLEFQTYAVNGMKEMVRDTSVKTKRRIYSTSENLPGLKRETLAPYERLLQRVYYKLQYNHSSGKGNFYNYSNVASVLKESIFAPLAKKDITALRKFLTKNAIYKETDLYSKCRKLEDVFKSEINIIENNAPELSNLSFVFSKKIASETGCIIFFINAFRELGVNFEVVITNNRMDARFIPNYEAYNFLDTYLLYVNDLQLYTQPTMFSRLGFVETEYIYTDGLFLKEIKIGDLSSLIGKVKKIDGPKSTASVDNMDLKVSFSTDFSKTDIQLNRISTGYKAAPYQTYLQYMDLANAINLKEDFAKYPDPKAKIINYTVENEKINDLGVHPFTVKSELSSDNLLQQAGDRYLFKIGELIGMQAEMYDETPRVLPVESEFNREYVRRIEIKIPNGYTIKNTSELNMSVVPEKTNKNIGFTSSYDQKEQLFIVEIKEWYNQIGFEIDEYPSYQKVINAAADFNKVVVVIEKL